MEFCHRVPICAMTEELRQNENSPEKENPARPCDRAGHVRRRVGAQKRGAQADGLPVGPRSQRPGRRSSPFAAAPSIGPSAGWPGVPPGRPIGSSSSPTNAESESVKLAALRAVLSDMMTVSKFSDLEDAHDRDRGAAP